jgi:hypothetical protein
MNWVDVNFWWCIAKHWLVVATSGGHAIPTYRGVAVGTCLTFPVVDVLGPLFEIINAMSLATIFAARVIAYSVFFKPHFGEK